VALGDARRRTAGWAENGLALAPRAAHLGLTARRSAAARSALVSQADSWTSEVASEILASSCGNQSKLGSCNEGDGTVLVLALCALASRTRVRSSDERALLSNVELTGRRRKDARLEPQTMYRVPAARAWWPAVGAPVERRVRHHCIRYCELRCRCATQRLKDPLSGCRVLQ
jgi:hypothetical protein